MSFPDLPAEGHPDPYPPTIPATPPPFAMSPPPLPYAMSPVPGPPPESLHDSRAFGIVGIVLGALALAATTLSVRPIAPLAGILVAIITVVLGHIGFARGGNGGKGQGVAVAALILGYLAIAIGIVHLAGLIAVTRLLRRRRSF